MYVGWGKKGKYRQELFSDKVHLGNVPMSRG
jgi:hypothetical protein